jgi:hypothetical protein
MGERDLDPREPFAQPEIQVVEGAGLDPDEDLVLGDPGLRDLLQLQDLGSPVRVEANRSHRQSAVSYRQSAIGDPQGIF